MFVSANYKGLKMNKSTLKSRATLIGKVFEVKGVKLSRAEQLELVAKLEGARGWNHASGELRDGAAPAENTPLDALQLEVAKAYCAGDFSEVVDTSGVAAKGDMLFHFAMAEVGDVKGNRDEAVNLMRQASQELENLADALEDNSHQAQIAPAPVAKAIEYDKLEATDSHGVPLKWRIRYLTNRFGEDDIVDAYGSQDLRDWLNGHPAELAKMWDVCLGEMAFVVELNGVRGVLYEVELDTAEADRSLPDGGSHCQVTEAERRVQLQQGVAELEAEHPNLTWAVIGPDGMWDGRLGVWGFFPEAKLITKDEAQAVVDTLVEKFYGK